VFNIGDDKKTEFWAVLSIEPRPAALTTKRMEKLRVAVWHDADFWDDIVARHGGMTMTAAELRMSDAFTFEHCLGNFHGMLMQTLIESRAGR